MREALMKVERYGLVVKIPNKETIATSHSTGEIRERLAIRVTLEVRAFLEATPRLTKDDYAALERKLRRISDSFKRKEYFDAAQFDLDLPYFIWQRSGNETLCEMLDRLTTPLFAFTGIMRSTGTEELKDIVAPREDLLAALKSKKPSKI